LGLDLAAFGMPRRCYSPQVLGMFPASILLWGIISILLDARNNPVGKGNVLYTHGDGEVNSIMVPKIALSSDLHFSMVSSWWVQNREVSESRGYKRSSAQDEGGADCECWAFTALIDGYMLNSRFFGIRGSKQLESNI
jgi:hypothetical protein